LEKREPGLAGGRRWIWAGGVALMAAAIAYPAIDLLRLGVAALAGAYRPLGGGLSGIYQWLIGLWVTGGIVAYAVVWRTPAADTFAVMASVALGVGAGLLSLLIHYDARNVVAVVNPIEHMFAFASASSELSQQTQVLSAAFFTTLGAGVGRTLAAHGFVLGPSGRPTLLLEWFAMAGSVVLWRSGERAAVVRIALLILAALGIDTIFSLRKLQLVYTVYTDPLLIVAAALVLARFPQLQKLPRAQNAAFGLGMLYLVWGHVEPVRQAITQGHPEDACLWFPAALRQVGPFSICRPHGDTALERDDFWKPMVSATAE
jgi:hypothetical protein